MITVNNLSKIYGDTTVLSIPELKINANESFGLVGNNGAGKTTFFRLILDLIRANSGSIKSKGMDVKGSTDWKFYTGSYLDARFLIDFLTPEEYFEFISQVHRMSKGDLDLFYQEFDDFFAGEILGKKKYIRDFSHGNKQKIGVAAALMAKPEIVILDEPFNGLDPSTQLRLIRMLNELKTQKGITLLISSHDLNHVNEVCDRIVILEHGEIKFDMQKNESTLKEMESYFAR
ncbi:MAG: ABC transporter ATP-binding protein [Bacteroidales bacterium]|nr:ABC transporter ATP-binding protein [Bacteroidales bacterium]